MRIIGGELKGRKLFSVRGTHTRPTADRIREAIFNILVSRVPEAIVLDLFAGTGALGLEALSRGAQRAIFIETNKHALSVLRRNIKVSGLENKAIIIQWNILKNLNCLQSLDPGISLVFMDPPYDEHLIEPTLFNLHDSGCLRVNACVTIEHSQSETISLGELPFHQLDQRSYGKTFVSFLRYVL